MLQLEWHRIQMTYFGCGAIHLNGIKKASIRQTLNFKKFITVNKPLHQN